MREKVGVSDERLETKGKCFEIFSTNKIFCIPQVRISISINKTSPLKDFCQFLLGKAYTYLRFATILQRILAKHMCALRRLSTCLGD